MKVPEANGLVSVLLMPLAVACIGLSQPRWGLHIGDRLPAVRLTDSHGNTVTLSEAVAGKVALLRFWSIDCARCDNEILLSLDALHRKYRVKGFIPIAIQEGGSGKGDNRFDKFDQLTYPLLIDEDGKAAEYLGVVGLPTTFIVDETRIVREKIIGEVGIDGWERLMTRILYKEGFYDGVY